MANKEPATEFVQVLVYCLILVCNYLFVYKGANFFSCCGITPSSIGI